MRKLLLFLWLLSLCSVFSQSNAESPVHCIDRGESVLLDNGIVAFEINKTSGEINALKYRGKAILASPGYLDWISNGNNHLRNGAFALCADPTRNGGEMVEVLISQKYSGSGSPFDVELHYVLRRGDSGPYVFAVFHHAADYPPGEIGTARWVLRTNDAVFDTVNVDEQRRRLMPPSGTPVKILGPKESMMITDGPFKGFVTDKYHHFTDAGDHFVHGWTGSKSNLGCWILYGSTEDHNGGPTKQHNTAHFQRLLHKILTCAHYGAAPIRVEAGEAWTKIYGPWMLYLNSAENADALWADAKNKASTERKSWPYAWMNNPQYPLAEGRGVVTGRLQISDAHDPKASPANAWVGLAAPQPDWQQQSNNYQFWTRAEQDGRFKIPAVRAGSYTLYALVDGVMGEFRRDGVAVEKGQTSDLGTLVWTPMHRGKPLWQIGTPDRTAKEFRHGDDYRQWGLWLKYPQEFPGDVQFTLGKSRERTDWNYAQVNVQKDRQWMGTSWNIIFNHSAKSKGTATLRLAIAGARRALLRVLVNGQQVGDLRVDLDNAMVRAGIHGQYAEEDVPFDAALLQPGENKITLEQRRGGNHLFNVMYDCVRLELDETMPFDKRSSQRSRKRAVPVEMEDAESE